MRFENYWLTVRHYYDRYPQQPSTLIKAAASAAFNAGVTAERNRHANMAAARAAAEGEAPENDNRCAVCAYDEAGEQFPVEESLDEIAETENAILDQQERRWNEWRRT